MWQDQERPHLEDCILAESLWRPEKPRSESEEGDHSWYGQYKGTASTKAHRQVNKYLSDACCLPGAVLIQRKAKTDPVLKEFRV